MQFILDHRLAIAYALIALIIAGAVFGIVLWRRQRERRRRERSRYH